MEHILKLANLHRDRTMLTIEIGPRPDGWEDRTVTVNGERASAARLQEFCQRVLEILDGETIEETF